MKLKKLLAGFFGLCVVAVLLVGIWRARGNHPHILLFPALGRPDQVRVSGRLLANEPPGGSALTRNLSRLFAPSWHDASITVVFDSREVVLRTGPHGDFEAAFIRPPDRPWAPGSYAAQAVAEGASSSVQLQVLDPATPFLVISDFDDTLAETHVLDKRKFAKAVFLQDGQTQPPVAGMAEWYRCMATSHAIAPAFALVSGSPIQYSERIGAFLSKHELPFLGLYLRHLSPQTLHDYKQPMIRKLLNEFALPVVLIGDSGEDDPEAYRQMREEFGDRIKAVFIHDVGRSEDSSRFAGMYLFRGALEARQRAELLGLNSHTCQFVPPATPPSPNPLSRTLLTS